MAEGDGCGRRAPAALLSPLQGLAHLLHLLVLCGDLGRKRLSTDGPIGCQLVRLLRHLRMLGLQGLVLRALAGKIRLQGGGPLLQLLLLRQQLFAIHAPLNLVGL